MRRFCVAMAALVLLPAGCWAQVRWSVASLHPAGASSSQVLGGIIFAGGYAAYDGVTHAGCWTGSSSNDFRDLHPAGATDSRGLYSLFSYTAGYATFDGKKHASYWNSEEGPYWPAYTDLHPSWAQESVATTLFPLPQDPNYVNAPPTYSQAGYVKVDGVSRAVVWDARDRSCHYLDEEGVSESSVARGMWWSPAAPSQNSEGANAVVGSARLWMPYAEQPVDTACIWLLMDPYYGHWQSQVLWASNVPNAEGPSEALSILVDHITGYITVGGAAHAALWAANDFGNCTDLNPAGASSSVAATASRMASSTSYTDIQLGYAEFDGVRHAGFWSGTAESWFDLHSLLDPSIYAYSEATGGYLLVEATTSIMGWAYNTVTGRQEAVAWTMAVPEPSSWAAVLGGCVSALAMLRRKRL